MANFSPVATVILSFFLLREKLTVFKVSGMLPGFTGIILAAFTKGGDLYAAQDIASISPGPPGNLSDDEKRQKKADRLNRRIVYFRKWVYIVFLTNRGDPRRCSKVTKRVSFDL